MSVRAGFADISLLGVAARQTIPLDRLGEPPKEPPAALEKNDRFSASAIFGKGPAKPKLGGPPKIALALRS